MVNRCRDKATWRYDAKRRVLGPETLPLARSMRCLRPRNRAWGLQPCRQPVRRNDSDRTCRWGDLRGSVGPRDRPLPVSDVNDVVRPMAQPVGERQEEGEFAGGVASEPYDQTLVGGFEALPEGLEIVRQAGFMDVRPPRRPLARRSPGDRTAAEIVGAGQDFGLAAGEAQRLPQAAARRIARDDVQDFHGYNYVMYRVIDNQTSVALWF